MTQIPEKPRWLYRFDNFKRAFTLLREAIDSKKTRDLTQLEKEGVIQRFEYTWELAWKVLRDYLEYSGVILETITPASTLKAAFAAKLIDEGEVWMRALDARNKIPHIYKLNLFEEIITEIEQDFLRILNEMYMKMPTLMMDKEHAHMTT